MSFNGVAGGESSAAGSKPRPRPGQKPKQTGKALVKAVLSGDTLVLMGAAQGDAPAPEREVTLSGIKAPTFARGKQATDEPFAWHSREFLRKKLIGKPVTFTVLYKHDGGREYVSVQLGMESIAHTVVAHGWARVPVKEGEKLHEDRQELYNLQQQAEAAGLGVHARGVAPLQAIRDVNWFADPVALFNRLKGIQIPAIIDKVIDGTTYRVEFLGEGGPADLRHTIITLNLTGAEAPPTPIPDNVLKAQYEKKKEDDPDFKAPKKEKPKPWALEAQRFVEARLLHRDVKVVLNTIDKSGAYFGTILYGKGDITERLLELGYAKVVRWSALMSGTYERLAKAEEAAKAQKLRLWANYSEKKEASQQPREIVGTVTQIISGDRLAIVPVDGDKEVKVSLSSIRAPRLGVRGSAHEPCAFDAREWLRTRLIGKKVKAVVDYVRPPAPDAGSSENSINVSLFLGNHNVNEGLVAEGYATVSRHRKNEDRAFNYDRLVEKQ